VRRAYLTIAEVAESLMLHAGQVEEMLALGELTYVVLPWSGPVVPVSLLPPFCRVSEQG
jgi:hypothetical protein